MGWTTRLTGLGLVVAGSLAGCAFPMGGYGPPANRPIGPTTGYMPTGSTMVGGPVAIGPVAPVTTFAPTTGTTTAMDANARYYRVTQGDESLSKVATRYNVSEAELRKLNNLNAGDNLAPGQLVRVPDGATAIR
jgi:LysM repeat protein